MRGALTVIKALKKAVLLLALLVFVARSEGESVTINGDIGLDFSTFADSDGNFAGWNFTGSPSESLEVDPTSLVTPIGLLPFYRNGTVQYWSDPSIWDNVDLDISNAFNVDTFIVGLFSFAPSIQAGVKAVNTLENLGPTETTLSLPVPVTSVSIEGFALNLNVGFGIRYDVTLDNGSNLIMDQSNVTVQSLTVNSGASLTANSSFDTRTDLINHGLIYNLGGMVEGDLLNDGTATGSGAFITNNLTVQGNFTNTGAIEIDSGGALIRSGATINAGTMRLYGGSLNVAGGLTNVGNIQWSSGVVSGALNNSGTIINSGTGTAPSLENAVLNNLSSGVIDMQGDGGFGGSYDNYGTSSSTINNAGLLRKSAGSGISTITAAVAVNNTGTIEVDSGTLELDGGYVYNPNPYGSNQWSSSTNGTFVFNNGGRVTITLPGTGDGYYVSFSGTNTGTGDGVLEISTGGLVSGSASPTLNFTGGSKVLLDGGLVMGSAAPFLNMGNFEWSSGVVSGALNNSGTIINSGTGTAPSLENAVLNNLSSGVIDLQGDGGFGGNYGNFGVSASIINNAGLLKKSAGSGVSTITSAVAFSNTGTVEVDSGTLEFDGGYNQTAGHLLLHGGAVATNGTLNIQEGTFEGSGFIIGNLSLLNGSYLVLSIGGLTQYDSINVTGAVSLGGELDLSFLNGFESELSSEETFTLLTASNGITGLFDNIANGAVLDTSDGLGSFVVNYGPTSPFGSNEVVLTQGVSTVPEPSGICLFAVALLSVLTWRKR